MNILVCIKQVPDTTEIRIDPVTNTLIREGVPSIVNPFDGYALEMALRIRDENGGKVVVISMGPPQAKAVLREAIAHGADKTYLITDRAFGGSDTLATSYILTRAMKSIEEKEGKFDIIFCGKQAIDGDTAQVGPEIAEHLGYPQITFATDVRVENGKVIAKRLTENGKELWEGEMPLVITTSESEHELRYPNVDFRLASFHTDIPACGVNEISADPEKSGFNGSPTKVRTSYVPPRKPGGVLIKGETLKESALKLASVLNDAGLV